MIISTSQTGTSGAFLASAQVPDPEPGPHEVLIDVAGAGINRADLLQVAGHYPPPPGAPEWPGLEVSGTVASVGALVSKYRPGDAVMALLAGGGYAQRVAVHEDLAVPVPRGVDLVAAGGLMEAACTAWSNFQAAGARAGHTVLIHGGSGGVGSLAIQIARAASMRVLTTAGGPERVQRCRDLGADVAIDHRGDDVVARVREAGGADVIVDVLGAGGLDANLRCLNTGGALVVIGMQRGSKGELDVGRLLAKRARIIGTTLRSRPHEDKAAIVASVREHVVPWIPERVAPVVHATYPLSEAQAAHDALRDGEVFGKLILTPAS